MKDDLARARAAAVLEEEDALISAEHQAPGADRDAEMGLGQRALDVGRHVIRPFDFAQDRPFDFAQGRPFGVVPIARVGLRHESLQEALEIPLHVGVDVLLDQGRGRCVPTSVQSWRSSSNATKAHAREFTPMGQR